jgi:hypothetical protein
MSRLIPTISKLPSFSLLFYSFCPIVPSVDEGAMNYIFIDLAVTIEVLSQL